MLQILVLGTRREQVGDHALARVSLSIMRTRRALGRGLLVERFRVNFIDEPLWGMGIQLLGRWRNRRGEGGKGVTVGNISAKRLEGRIALSVAKVTSK